MCHLEVPHVFTSSISNLDVRIICVFHTLRIICKGQVFGFVCSSMHHVHVWHKCHDCYIWIAIYVKYAILMCEIFISRRLSIFIKAPCVCSNIKVYYKYIICISKIYSFACDLTESLRCALKLYIYFYHICKQMFKFMFGTPFQVITHLVCTICTTRLICTMYVAYEQYVP